MGANVPYRPTSYAEMDDPRPRVKPDQLVITGYDDVDEAILRFSFRINPHKLQVSYKKDGQWVRTKFGYERQNWGNSLITLSYAGSSGVFRPGDGYTQQKFDMRKTAAWRKFSELERFWLNTGNSQRLMTLQYWGYEGEFEGVMPDFSFTHDVQRPFEIQYQFKFEGVPVRLPVINVDQQLPGESTPETAPLQPIDPYA